MQDLVVMSKDCSANCSSWRSMPLLVEIESDPAIAEISKIDELDEPPIFIVIRNLRRTALINEFSKVNFAASEGCLFSLELFSVS